jgi:ferritin-like metal-binding protein YciE
MIWIIRNRPRHAPVPAGMTRTASAAALLHAAIQDLHAGKRLQAGRLPALADAAGDPLAALLRAEADRAAAQAARLEATGLDPSGPANLWMAGILDDATRDSRSHQPGRLLDIALVGAVRKGKAAEIVSGETALALAAETGDAAIAAAVRANYDEEVAADRALRALLGALTPPPAPPRPAGPPTPAG